MDPSTKGKGIMHQLTPQDKYVLKNNVCQVPFMSVILQRYLIVLEFSGTYGQYF